MVNGYFGGAATHVVAESTNLLGTTYGRHIFNVKAGADIDNGKLVNLDDMVWNDNEYFSMVTPTASSRVGLILSAPVGAEATPYAATLPGNFYNAQNEIMRVYDLVRGDKFTISENGITKRTTSDGNGGTVDVAIAEDDYVIADGYDIKDAGTSAPSGKTFVGQIVKKINRTSGTFYKIVVRAND